MYWLNFTINVIHFRSYFYAISIFKDKNFLLQAYMFEYSALHNEVFNINIMCLCGLYDRYLIT